MSDEKPESEEQDEQSQGTSDPGEKFREQDVSDDEQQEIEEERERRLDEDNRPEGAIVDNTDGMPEVVKEFDKENPPDAAGTSDPAEKFREVEVSEEEKKEIEEERERRLDPDNRPENAEVDNTGRTFKDGQFVDDGEDGDDGDDSDDGDDGDEAPVARDDDSDDDSDSDDSDSDESHSDDDSSDQNDSESEPEAEEPEPAETSAAGAASAAAASDDDEPGHRAEREGGLLGAVGRKLREWTDTPGPAEPRSEEPSDQSTEDTTAEEVEEDESGGPQHRADTSGTS